jgi:hypothetical protein
MIILLLFWHLALGVFEQRATWNVISNTLPEKSSFGLFKFPWQNQMVLVWELPLVHQMFHKT